MKKNKIDRALYKNIFMFSLLLIVVIAISAMGILYYWSFYRYDHLFEDRIIDVKTLENAKKIGAENEWLLGVNTHSIDVLEATYNKDIKDHIYNQALTQEKVIQYYREKIDGKALIYCIELCAEKGEFFYRYSVIRDLYHEVFPYYVLTMGIFFAIVVLALFLYVRFIDKQFSMELIELQAYAQKLENLDLNIDDIKPKYGNSIIEILAGTFREMHIRLVEKENLQKSSLQYISHELKSPIMVIESYIISAKDGIYPAGTLDDSFDTILEQTNRMKDKVSSLLKYVTISTMDLKKSQFDLSDLLHSLLIDYQAQIHKKGTHIYHIQNKMDILADSEKIRVVFQNLLENQLKYRNSLMAIRAYKKGDTIIMLFYNDGEIISDQLKKQIFTPFMKGYNGSNGLGLSITKMILLQHSGNIELLKTNQGTLFKVTLPDSVL